MADWAEALGRANTLQQAGEVIQGFGKDLNLYQEMVMRRAEALRKAREEEMRAKLLEIQTQREEREAAEKAKKAEGVRKFQEKIALGKQRKVDVPGTPAQMEPWHAPMALPPDYEMPPPVMERGMGPSMAPPMPPDVEMSPAIPPTSFDVNEPYSWGEQAQMAGELGAIEPDRFLTLTEPQTPRGLSTEEWEERERIKAKIRADRPLTEFEKARMNYWANLEKRGDEGMDLRRQGLAIDRARLGLAQSEATTKRQTGFVKNTNELYEELHLFGKLDTTIPGGLYGRGGISGFGFGTKPFRQWWKTPEANSIRPTLQALINKILKRASGTAVTDQEFDRMETALGLNTSGTVEEFRHGLQNYYETARVQYENFIAADPQAARSVSESRGNIFGGGGSQQTAPAQSTGLEGLSDEEFERLYGPINR
jgi:hypothetical protein